MLKFVNYYALFPIAYLRLLNNIFPFKSIPPTFIFYGIITNYFNTLCNSNIYIYCEFSKKKSSF